MRRLPRRIAQISPDAVRRRGDLLDHLLELLDHLLRFADRFFLIRDFRAQGEQFLPVPVLRGERKEDQIEGLEQTKLAPAREIVRAGEFIGALVVHSERLRRL